MLKEEKLNSIYIDLMRDLKAMIEQRGSMAAFCKAHGISRPNLVACFSETNPSEISVGLYQRVCVALGLMKEANSSLTNLTLKQYLSIDNKAIYDSMISISYS